MPVVQLKDSPVPKGKYTAGVSSRRSVNTEHGPKDVYDFTVLTGEYKGRQCGSKWVNPNASGPKSGAYNLAKLLLGSDLPDAIDTDDFIGIAGEAQIDVDEKGKNQILFFEKNDDLTKGYKAKLAEAAQTAEATKVEEELPF